MLSYSITQRLNKKVSDPVVIVKAPGTKRKDGIQEKMPSRMTDRRADVRPRTRDSPLGKAGLKSCGF